MERTQVFEFEQNRFKCQSSILGLQTQLIEAYFFDKRSKKRNGKMTVKVSINQSVQEALRHITMALLSIDYDLAKSQILHGY